MRDVGCRGAAARITLVNLTLWAESFDELKMWRQILERKGELVDNLFFFFFYFPFSLFFLAPSHSGFGTSKRRWQKREKGKLGVPKVGAVFAEVLEGQAPVPKKCRGDGQGTGSGLWRTDAGRLQGYRTSCTRALCRRNEGRGERSGRLQWESMCVLWGRWIP